MSELLGVIVVNLGSPADPLWLRIDEGFLVGLAIGIPLGLGLDWANGKLTDLLNHARRRPLGDRRER